METRRVSEGPPEISVFSCSSLADASGYDALHENQQTANVFQSAPHKRMYDMGTMRNGFESLETKRLLAADLAVQLSTPHELIPGEFAAYTVEVTNRGTDDTLAEVISEATQHLDDVTWVRETTIQSVFNGDDLENVTVGSRPGVEIGDINGDGFADVYRNKSILFGTDSGIIDVAIEELDGTNGFRLAIDDARFLTVGGGGDVNGDGIDDFVVGQPYTAANQNGPQNGLATVVLGSHEWQLEDVEGVPTFDFAKINGANGFVAQGYGTPAETEAWGSGIGASVTIVDDINGDGLDDILIGGEGALWVRNNSAIYIVYGKAAAFEAEFNLIDLDGTNGFRLSGASSYVGESVAGAGDVNGDGFNDFVVGWFGGNPNSNATVVYGTDQNRSTVIDIDVLQPNDGYSLVGGRFEPSQVYPTSVGIAAVVSGLGDINGDGLADIALGAPQVVSPGRINVGEVYVVFGSTSESRSPIAAADLDGTNGFVLSTGEEFARLGTSVHGVGDFDGDGRDDMLFESGHQSWLLFGADSYPSTIDPRMFDGSRGMSFHASVRSAGDINGDGLADLVADGDVILGRARPEFNRTNGSGAIDELVQIAANTTVTYHVRGTVQATTSNPAELHAQAATIREETDTDNNEAGVVLPVVRDIDLVVESRLLQQADDVGELAFEYSVVNSGRATAVDTRITAQFSESLDELSWTRKVERPDPSYLQADIESLFQQDGIDLGDFQPTSDVRIADIDLDGIVDMLIPTSKGVHLVFGGSDATMSNGSILFESPLGADTIFNVQVAGDLNNDGLTDILMEDYDGRIARQTQGHTYVVFGPASYASPTFMLSTLDGTNGFRVVHPTEYPRSPISGIGDVNGDGFSDLRVGRAIVSGREVFDAEYTSELFTEMPQRMINDFIYGVSAAGDVNLDGIDDFVVEFRNNFRDEGYLFLGNRTETGEVGLSELGDEFPVFEDPGIVTSGSVGDVNGDGFPDVAIVFTGDIPATEVWGRATIVFGGENMAAAHIETLELSNLWETRLANPKAVGDINFDGIDDFYMSPGYTVFGSRNLPDLDSSLEALSEGEGIVGSKYRNVGDFNGDRIPDILIDDSFLLFGTNVVETVTGTGGIDQTVDVAVGSRVTYTIKGRLSDNIEAGSVTLGSFTSIAGPARTDINPADNSVEQKIVLATDLPGDLPSDFDGDGLVSFSDFLILSANFGNDDAAFADGDGNGDGNVDIADFVLLQDTYGKQ